MNTDITNFDLTDNFRLLSDLSTTLEEINREKVFGRFLTEVRKPVTKPNGEVIESVDLVDGTTRTVEAKSLKTLKELYNIYRKVGWIPNSVVTTYIDHFKVELKFDITKSPFYTNTE